VKREVDGSGKPRPFGVVRGNGYGAFVGEVSGEERLRFSAFLVAPGRELSWRFVG